MIKAIIFDCFGVLVADVLRGKANDIAKTDPARAEVIYDTLKQFDHGMISHEEGMARIAGALNITLEEAFATSHNGEVRNSELIDELSKLHHDYKLGLVSNVRGREWLDERFLPGELDRLFDVVIASGDVGIVKPDPGIYELAAERLGVNTDECVMIDDIQTFCDGAVVVGMHAIRYQSNHQVLVDLHALVDAVHD